MNNHISENIKAAIEARKSQNSGSTKRPAIRGLEVDLPQPAILGLETPKK